MEDINIALLQKKQKKTQLKQYRLENLKKKYEKIKKNFEKGSEEGVKISKHEKFYDQLFKQDKNIDKNIYKNKKNKKEETNNQFKPEIMKKKIVKRKFKLNRRGQPIMKYQIADLVNKLSKNEN